MRIKTMATGKRLLNNCMPANYKQGTLIPTYRYWADGFDKPYGNRRKKNAGHVRKAGQSKLRRQLNKELFDELENEYW